MKNTFYYIPTLLIICLLPLVASAQTPQQKEYQFDSIQMLGNTFKYGFIAPDDASESKKYPLVLALHGDEWMGTQRNPHRLTPDFLFNHLFSISEESSVQFSLGECWKSPDFFNRHPAHVLVPHIHDDLQLPNDNDIKWRVGDIVTFLDSLLGSYIASGTVDENRIYVTGHSIGGAGTLLASLKLKHGIAALVPSAPAIAPGRLLEFEEKIRNGAYDNMAMWYFHPNYEKVGNSFSVFKERNLCHNYIKSAGRELQNITTNQLHQKIKNRHRYLQTEYFPPYPESGSHYVMEYVVQDTLVYNWMFQQYRIDNDAIKITNLSADDYEINWSVKNPSDTVEIWFRDSTDWQLLTKNIFTLNQLTLTDYIEEERLKNGYLKICCINSEGFAYGLDERKIILPTYSSNGYLIDSLTIDDNTMPYGLLEPYNKRAGEKYPLILALHGAEWASSYRNITGVVQEKSIGGILEFYIATNLAKETIREKYPAYVVAPRHYVDNHLDSLLEQSVWYRKRNLLILDSIISNLITKGQVDPNRIYVTGHSIGGEGSFNMPGKLKYPIAAIAPMAAADDIDLTMQNLEKGRYKNIPIWCFDHYQDAESPERRRQFYNKLDSMNKSTVYTHAFGDSSYFLSAEEIQNKINNRYRYLYTEYHKRPSIMAHYAMEFASADTLFYNWLFNQYLIDEEATKITNLSSEDYNLSWTVKNPNDTVEIWFREDNDWQMVTKGVFTQNQIVLTNYLEESKLQQGFIRVASINPEGFMYGKDERKINASTTSLVEQNRQQVKIYPNPAKDFLFVENLLKSTVVQIYNLHGVLMKTDKINNNCLYIGDLPMGTYLIKIGSLRQIIRVK